MALAHSALSQNLFYRRNVFGVVELNAIPANGIERNNPNAMARFKEAQLLQPF
jgi:hypothetical protein